MQARKYLFSTLKETPHNSDCISHALMLRAGIIRQNTSGTYIWLPTGLRILKKVIRIIKNEMKQCGAMEIAMPFLQKKNLWDLSKRVITYGQELFQVTDRTNKKFILGPTHEEMITYFIKNELQSYKQLPLILYQIQTKFRDEIRPRFGIIRTKEFMMKDAYSFHINMLSLEKTYNLMYQTYIKIFKKMKLKFYAVEADSGLMGGLKSHEFQAPSNTGEDVIVLSTQSNYLANIQVATSIQNNHIKYSTNNYFKKIKILRNNNDIYKKLSNTPNFKKSNTIKTILVKTKNFSKHLFVAILIREDHTINEYKLSKINEIEYPLIFASKQEILNVTGTTKDFIGPINLDFPVIADFSVINLENFTIGSNITNKYFNNMNWNKDISIPQTYDIRYVLEGDPSPDGAGELKMQKSIEIAHIFQLGKKYSKIMNVKIQNKIGKKDTLIMGCYGIGITRIIAAIIEQNNDKNGIIWPDSIAPFTIAIIPVCFHKSTLVKQQSEKIYNFCKKNNIDALLDDRKQNLSITLSEIELIGIPYSIIISEKLLKNDMVEYRERHKNVKKIINKNHVFKIILNNSLK
ncbi:prolyl-tRNA synthetase [Buchnera aphidicola str. Bp (Baizongia pistaciae)]|uniref:Proline--tRNA ligase n=1 Tax=Buchnera aphidicola subsp. Baizongia pistaciae (strain Bp) TaxID=224915 RepID=SYP_BUCBP|nr:proline--tRNA ligase [Buchnera aphidicola]Q89AN7.1 RecName: Full=Proline--tRNA ligase; AltName: Full=Prolyl-tRNA synthetase; Short=ProRS [Buchnera aphidicola str. Bp (Baizongia pistaciae)]AAO26952.1 prolyl-tRNA synthetase [Buchnera aphidicola str. Bp (Baizongia pistaciae)]